jgi:hypothetical protein
MQAGYLVHIDGALTREYDAVDPSVDRKLLGRLESILDEGGRIALLTGRTEQWIDRHLAPLINNNNFLILGEYGNFRIWRNERYWDDKAHNFERQHREHLKERIAVIAKRHGVTVKPDDRDYEPRSGELWFAPGVGVLSVRTNRHGHQFGVGVDAGLVYKITMEAIKESGLAEEEFDIEQTPISTVVSRKGMNLENAARIAVGTLDPEVALDKWYAFGRSMDESMAYDPKIEFVCVSSKASKDVWDFLSKL